MRGEITVDEMADFEAWLSQHPTFVETMNESSEGRGSQSYTGSGVMIPAESSPAKIFARMFLQGKPAEIAEQKRKLREGRSILDELMEQTRSLSRKASAADRQRMDAYTESVRKTERDLFAAEAWLDRAKPQAHLMKEMPQAAPVPEGRTVRTTRWRFQEA